MRSSLKRKTFKTMVSILKWFLLICSYKISIKNHLPYFELKESFDYKPTTYSLFDDEASFISTNSFIPNNANPNVRFTFLRVNRTAPKIYYYLFFVKKREHIAHKTSRTTSRIKRRQLIVYHSRELHWTNIKNH